MENSDGAWPVASLHPDESITQRFTSAA